jgi:hypothetical protein
MMTQLCTVVGSGDEVATLTTDALLTAGLKVVRSFDLSSARIAHGDCSCSHHGTALCDCQMIVLFVYGDVGNPVTLTFHGRDGHTRLLLVKEPGQQSSSELETTIINTLLSAFLPHAHLEVLSS